MQALLSKYGGLAVSGSWELSVMKCMLHEPYLTFADHTPIPLIKFAEMYERSLDLSSVESRLQAAEFRMAITKQVGDQIRDGAPWLSIHRCNLDYYLGTCHPMMAFIDPSFDFMPEFKYDRSSYPFNGVHAAYSPNNNSTYHRTLLRDIPEGSVCYATYDIYPHFPDKPTPWH